MAPVVIRRLAPGDSMAALTDLLHRAYAPLAAAGLRFLATHQDEKTTAERCAEGECWVAELDGRVAGTIVWRAGKPGKCAWYGRPGVAVFGQFAVEPSLQKAGLGARLLDHVERRVRDAGFSELACDTAEGATDLIAYYTRRGFEPVDSVCWDVTNYRSVILSKPLAQR
jgi:GNAT superfamily N-acetyltransferase